MPPRIQDVPLSAIDVAGSWQPRCETPQDRVELYADLWDEVDFPAVDLFGEERPPYWLGDGFTRVAACEVRFGKRGQIRSRIHPGTARDAQQFALAANSRHGSPFSRADHRRIVVTVLRDPEWGTWSPERVREHVGRIMSVQAIYTLRDQDRAGLLDADGMPLTVAGSKLEPALADQQACRRQLAARAVAKAIRAVEALGAEGAAALELLRATQEALP